MRQGTKKPLAAVYFLLLATSLSTPAPLFARTFEAKCVGVLGKGGAGNGIF